MNNIAYIKGTKVPFMYAIFIIYGVIYICYYLHCIITLYFVYFNKAGIRTWTTQKTIKIVCWNF